MIDRKCNCENEVSRQILAVLNTKKKVALAKKHSWFEKAVDHKK